MITFRIFFFAIFFLSFQVFTQAFALGTLMIQGKLTSITSRNYVIETDKSIYYIKKDGVAPQQAKILERTETMVSLPVSMLAIDKIKTKASSAIK